MPLTRMTDLLSRLNNFLIIVLCCIKFKLLVSSLKRCKKFNTQSTNFKKEVMFTFVVVFRGGWSYSRPLVILTLIEIAGVALFSQLPCAYMTYKTHNQDEGGEVSIYFYRLFKLD